MKITSHVYLFWEAEGSAVLEEFGVSEEGEVGEEGVHVQRTLCMYLTGQHHLREGGLRCWSGSF